MKVIVENKNWKHANGVYVRGEGFVKERYFSAIDLLAYFSSVQTEEMFKERLSQLNGCFAVILNTPAIQAAAIDITRIYPLFYANLQGEWCITDNAKVIANYGVQFDNMALAQYKCSGSTFAGRTLVQGMHQMMPSYYLLFHQSLMRQIPFKAYAEPLSQWPAPLSMKEYQSQLDEVFLHVFHRLLRSINNRQLVIPLSGGYDSRLILTFLRRLNYTKVLCYTIGSQQNPECIRAEKVARQLGYPLERIDNQEFIKGENPVESVLFKDYFNFIGAYTNFHWLFELPALLTLTTRGLVEKDAIFVPGHSADFLSGSQLEKGQISPHASIKAMTRTILIDNFPYEYPTKHSVYDEILAYMNKGLLYGIPSYIVYTDFLMRNHIVPQINNAARIYDFFGKDVRLPFWDDEVIFFFFHLPYACLRNRKLYRTYVHALFQQYHIDFYQEEVSSRAFFWKKFKNRIQYYFPSIRSYVARKKYAHLKEIDCSGEWGLAQPLLKEMKQQNPNYLPVSVNELLKDWYLKQISKGLKSTHS